MATTLDRVASGPSQTQTRWEIDPAHTEVGFSVKHLMISTVHGRFGGVRGTIVLYESDLTRSSTEVEIDAATIDTHQGTRDAHLRSADFFDVEKYPTITFRSHRVERVKGNRYRIIGDLTMHGVTRELTLDARDQGRKGDPEGGERLGFSATATVDRRDFGLNWNQALETGGVLAGNEIKITIDVEAKRTDE